MPKRRPTVREDVADIRWFFFFLFLGVLVAAMIQDWAGVAL